jgi:hypothetical protein
MKKQKRVGPMIHGGSARRIAQAAAVVLLTCSALARANDCAGGMHASGNDCSDDPAVLSEAYTRITYLKGAVTAGELAVIKAKDRQSAANAGVTAAEANLKSARTALSNAEMSASDHGAVDAAGREAASARAGGRAAALRRQVFEERRARFKATAPDRPVTGPGVN